MYHLQYSICFTILSKTVNAPLILLLCPTWNIKIYANGQTCDRINVTISLRWLNSSGRCPLANLFTIENFVGEITFLLKSDLWKASYYKYLFPWPNFNFFVTANDSLGGHNISFNKLLRITYYFLKDIGSVQWKLLSYLQTLNFSSLSGKVLIEGHNFFPFPFMNWSQTIHTKGLWVFLPGMLLLFRISPRQLVLHFSTFNDENSFYSAPYISLSSSESIEHFDLFEIVRSFVSY